VFKKLRDVKTVFKKLRDVKTVFKKLRDVKTVFKKLPPFYVSQNVEVVFNPPPYVQTERPPAASFWQIIFL
jgi:hypothetical protein